MRLKFAHWAQRYSVARMFPNPGTSFRGFLPGYRRGMRAATVGTLAALALLSGCTSGQEVDPAPGTLPTPSQEATPTVSSPSDRPSPSSTPSAQPERVDVDDVRAATARAAVRHLANEIGPRPGTSPAYLAAANWVAGRLSDLGWQVEQTSFQVPGGFSVAGPTEGLPVAAGRSVNVVATRGDVVAGQPWLAVGAHLDTVPTSPGAEDNASGIGALLAVAEATAGRGTRLPVVLVAFGAEEPRGPTDDDHHYGSRAYVASLSTSERETLRGMVSLDRVGVGTVVPVGSCRRRRPAARRGAGRRRARRRTDRGRVRAAVQRPLVVRARRSSGRPAREHAVRRLPLAGRRGGGCRPGAADPGGAGRRGLVALTLAHLVVVAADFRRCAVIRSAPRTREARPGRRRRPPRRVRSSRSADRPRRSGRTPTQRR